MNIIKKILFKIGLFKEEIEDFNIKVCHGQRIYCSSDKCKDICRSIKTIYRYIYEKKCKCGNKLFVTTQRNDEPEYHTSVGVPCNKCGELVFFKLPVN